MSATKEAVDNLLNTVVKGFKGQAEAALGDAKAVLEEAADMAGALSLDFARGALTSDQLADGMRKIGLTCESAAARIARENARAYVMNVLKALTGGAVSILGGLRLG